MTVIRQAISCDICGTEKKQTNHWFVAYDQGGELRVSGWNSRNRLRPGSKHLCGQTCLHKLVDDFMAKALSVRPSQAVVEEIEQEEAAIIAESRPEPRTESRMEAKPMGTRLMEARSAAAKPAEARPTEARPVEARVAVARASQSKGTDTSLTEDSAYDEFESSARLLTPPEPVKRPVLRPTVELVAVAGRLRSEEPVVVMDDAPRFASRNWRAEAWEREREREQRSVNQHGGLSPRRRSS